MASRNFTAAIRVMDFMQVEVMLDAAMKVKSNFISGLSLRRHIGHTDIIDTRHLGGSSKC